MKAITETLDVSRSNQYEKAKKPRQRYRTAEDDACSLQDNILLAIFLE